LRNIDEFQQMQWQFVSGPGVLPITECRNRRTMFQETRISATGPRISGADPSIS